MFEYILEETLSAKDKKEIPDSMYGLVYTDEDGKNIRKFPLNDETHVRQAAIFFDRAKGLTDEQKRELARNIIKRAKELDMDYSGWESLKPYLDKSMKEYYGPDETTGTSDFDQSDNNDPDDCYCEQESSSKKFKKKLEQIYESVTSKSFPEQFDDYSSNDHFKDELKNFVNLAEFVTKKSVPHELRFPSLHYLWNLAKASIDSIAYKDYIENHRKNIEECDRRIKDFEIKIAKLESSKESIESLKKCRDNAINTKEQYIKSIDWAKNKRDVISNISRLLHKSYFAESFEEMFGPVIQEAFDAVTGKEIPIDKAYTLEEMKERTISLDEVKSKDKDGLIPVKPPKVDEVYFGSPTNHMPEIDLNRPLFVTPYKGIASIFIWGDMGLQDRIPRGTYNHNYEEWVNFDEKKMKNPLKEVHVYVEGAPFLEPFAVEQEGYIHCISTKDYLNNFSRKPWMTKDLEYLIANTNNMKVEFTRSIKCKVKYYIKGRPSPKGKQYGPSRDGILQYIRKIAKSIHAKYKADQKEPTGNQNCLLCTWCAEASIRGGEYLPRPVYSPRDPALEIVPGDIVGGVTKKNPGNFYDMLEYLRGAEQPFARWYCHVKWGHGNGGHEFLIVKIDEDAFNIMDPQQGIVRPLTADDSYMKNVDWEGTYICRIDDKPFKYIKLDQINDPKKTLPWDPKKDIPYMVKHGLCTKEEAEKELKRHETNAFYSALKKELNQSPIQESAIGEIINGVIPWSKKRVFHISQQGHLDGQIFTPRVPEYLDKYDPSKDKFEDVENPRVCFSPSIEGCLNAIMVNIGRWKADKYKEWYVYSPEKPLKDYKHKTTKELIKEKKVYDANVTDEIWIEEPVRLKQYGIIRIDQVSSKSVKNTVPTTTGFQGHRYKYSFKWHWLVKPKVIADVPYDYSPMGVCKDMVDEAYNFKYGLGYDGSVHKATSEEYDTKYRLESPEEFEKNGGGICFDFVEWMDGYLAAYGYSCKKYFISTESDDNMTHTFLLVDDGKGGYIYPEASFDPLQGVHEVKYPEQAVAKIMEEIYKIHDKKPIKYYAWEYSGHPPYGSGMETCMKYFSKGEPFHEGTISELKRKD